MATNEFLKYKIQQHDTLLLLSKRVGINPIELKFFHNKICAYNERIYFEDLSYYKFVYIPLNYLSEIEVIKEQYSERPLKKFSSQFYTSSYTVEEKFNYIEEEFTITYKIELNFIEVKEKSIVSVVVSDFKKNSITPDDKISLLALACTKSITPLSFIISENGELSSFFEHQTLVENFRKNKNEIKEYHIGNVSETYLNSFEKSIENESYFLNQIKNTPLYQLLFPKLDWFYKKETWEEMLFTNKHYNNSIFELTATYLHDHKPIVDTIIKGKSKLEDEINIQYKTGKVTKKLIEISATINFQNAQHYLKIKPIN